MPAQIKVSKVNHNLIFHLTNSNISYILGVEEHDVLTHYYFGKRVNDYSGVLSYPRLDRSFSPNFADATDRNYSIDTFPQEYPSFGAGDFREPAVVVDQANGSSITQFAYQDYQITDGKQTLAGLPSTFADSADAKTLSIRLYDHVAKITVKLNYTIFADSTIITRSTKIENNGEQPVVIRRATSMNLDIPRNNYQLLQLPGRYAEERQLFIEDINPGIKVLDSKRSASSHMQSPFFALVTPGINEQSGTAYGFSLIYSGSHKSMIQKDPYEQLRIQMGINDFNFNWQLAKKQSFQTPEVMMNYSDHGLNALSQSFHQLIQHHLIRSKFVDKPRPILINNWEATYFDFDEEKIQRIIKKSAELGVELFVLDDGWFGHRNDDKSSLGDWYVNKQKLPNGLSSLANLTHKLNMKFGLWFEPEMISADSDLYREHPDWAIQTPNRPMSLGRDQYVLDFGRKEIRDNIFKQMCAILDHADIDYIKWDMNRNITELYNRNLPAAQQGEAAHRYILGVYDFMDKLTTRYPNILFEGCSGGGGRFDAGMLYYTPQIWTSDNTDAAERVRIQYGTSLVFPPVAMGAHVSKVTNPNTGRTIDINFRSMVASSANMGYELDPFTLTDEQIKVVETENQWYKDNRDLIQFGQLYRLISPFKNNQAAWMFVNDNQSEAIVMFFNLMNQPSYPLTVLKLQGLDPDTKYQINGRQIAYGSELMNLGFYPMGQPTHDFTSARFEIKKVSSHAE
ncbi:alpha-galactosidase [Lentilactobacillus kisonensis]|uniref:Alpha-galactosidase n=1 Tax=Lentilactobacillus kisonensis F0435 TaxID=797516 RepID=H1LEA4_9LACO|nr:alpha-galactosidase [Lentilactobacillus kisonensis]EHO52600.1 alpha-galactosidase [Lentilactobacillus kisonensis F0435]